MVEEAAIHNSWKKASKKFSTQPPVQAGYINGVSDFREKALKALEERKQDYIREYGEDSDFIYGVRGAIQMIKTLTA